MRRLVCNLGAGAGLVGCAALLNGGPPVAEFETLAAGQPINHSAPALTGDQRLGGELHCGRGHWDDPEGAPYSVTYQWRRDGAELAGRTNPTYAVVSADIRRSLRCDVTATGSSGLATAQSTTLSPPAPVNVNTPKLSGDTRLRQALACSRGSWNDDGLPAYPTTREWLRNGVPIVGEAGAGYTLTVQDVGTFITCRVSIGTLASATSPGLLATAPQSRRTPEISGDLRLGGTLTCSRATWDDEGLAPYSVTKQWLRDGSNIIGAVGDEIVVGPLHVNHSISCRVRAGDLTDATSSAVHPTSPAERSQPVIEGDLRLGRPVTCTRGTWDDQGRAADYDVSYEWYRSGILVADTQGYDVTAADVNKTLRCQVVAEGLTTRSSQTLSVPDPDNRTLPLLSGDARFGRTLTCSRGVWDDAGITPYAVEYQWLRSSVALAGETSTTHVVTADDVNTSLSCRVRAAGFTSATSAAVSAQPPENLITPYVEGDPRVGETLTCTRGDWDDVGATAYATTYQWFRASSNVPIDGATSASYEVTADDLNKSLFCGVTAAGLVRHFSSTAAITSQATGSPPVILITPRISGDRRLRHVLTCNRGSWNDTAAARHPVTYRWRRNGVVISGATTNQYTIAVADMGQSLTCDVTASTQTTATTPAVGPAAPEVVSPPGISGDRRLRRTLSCSRGEWYDDAADRYAVTYRWLRNGAPITGATAATYQITPADVSTGIFCEVRAENLTAANTSSVSISAPRITLNPSLSGNPRLRSTLTCSRGTWDDIAQDRYAVSYSWLRNSIAIPGASGASYTLTTDDVGMSVSCVVRAESMTNAGSLNAASIGAPQNRVVPRLSGNPRLRQELSCSRGDWDDVEADRYAVTYRWLRDSVQIPGATISTYTTVAADVNHSISCRVRAESLTDATSTPTTIRPPAIEVPPTVEGVPRMYRTLTCSRGDWDDTAADRYAVTFVWLRNSVLIPGAAQSAYNVTRDDVNKSISCRVRAAGLTDATASGVFVETPNNTLRPSISGQPHMRGELTCSRGAWDDTAASRYAVSYQWYRSGVPINGATSPSYVVGVADINRSITCSAIAEALRESFAVSDFVTSPSSVILPAIQGIAHPRRELTCSRGEWNDSAGARYAVSYQWRRGNVDIPGADAADHIVVAADVGTFLSCVVTAEGTRTALSASVLATWEPLQLSVVPDADAVTPSSTDVYTMRLRNPNPAPVAISRLELTMPGGFSHRVGTTSGAITADPVLTGPGALTLRWSGGFTVPELADAVVRVGVTATAQAGDHFASARAFPVNSAFTVTETGQTARVTVEGSAPTPGTCTIVGTPGADLLDGTAGADVICGLGGDDRLRGVGGADELWGGPGDDRLDGGAGADTLRGGDGADVLDGATEGDVLQGGGGLDTLSYATRGAAVTVTIGAGDGNDGAAGEGDTVASDVEIVRGGSGADDLAGGLGPDELYGRSGDDRLTGGDGAGDLLDGGDGADTLIDDDGLIDRLICGGGLDAFAVDILDRVVGCETPFVSQPAVG